MSGCSMTARIDEPATVFACRITAVVQLSNTCGETSVR